MASAISTVIVLLFLSSPIWTHDHVHTELKLGQISEIYLTPCNEFTYFKVTAEEPCQDLTVEVIQVEGEPNVYISKAPTTEPTIRSLSWSSYNWGSEKVVISSWEPDYHTGIFYIGVMAYCSGEVKTNYTDAQYRVHVYHSQPTEHPFGGADLYNIQVEGTIPAQFYQFHRFCVPEQCLKVDVTIEHCMVPTDPGCNGHYGYPELLVSKTIEQPRVNDISWKLADAFYRSVTLSPDMIEFEPGHYYIGIYGWCTPEDECPNVNTCGACSRAENLPYNISVTSTPVSDSDCKKMMSNRNVDQKDDDHTNRAAVSIVSLELLSSAIMLILALVWHI